jgi:NAD(P)-dependent dehydrogenase (short-subunit alcohol dehydrogenase family)
MPDAKRVVITGVSRGLGLAMTEEFIGRGHLVVGCARSRASIEELRQRFPTPHDFAVVDVSDDAQVAGWAARVLKSGEAPDLLINNAALINLNAKLWEVPPDEFSRVIDVNIKGTYHVLRHLVPAMIRRGAGVIVNFSSYWGRSTAPEVAPYCATKWAIEGLTQALAEELPAGLAAVPFNPGVIDTDMLRSCFGADAAAYPDPDRWAKQAVPFLLALGPKDNGRPLTAPE